jgi:hypothetical protein
MNIVILVLGVGCVTIIVEIKAGSSILRSSRDERRIACTVVRVDGHC